jgi:hypothetical protein
VTGDVRRVQREPLADVTDDDGRLVHDDNRDDSAPTRSRESARQGVCGHDVRYHERVTRKLG